MGFYSVSAPGNRFAIRARTRKHLDNLRTRHKELAAYTVVVTEDADYRYRLIVEHEVWAQLVGEMVLEQDWSNFKSEVLKFQGRDEYERALHDVWEMMHKTQMREPEERARSAAEYDKWLAERQKGLPLGKSIERQTVGR
jgi:hypothetical protein